MTVELSRRNLLKLGAVSLVAVGGSGLITGCSSSGNSDGADKQINALLINLAGHREFWPAAASKFAEETGITVNFDMLETSPLTSKMITLTAVGNSDYDLYSTHTARAAAFKEHFMDLNGLIPDDTLQDFFTGISDTFTDRESGSVFAAPINIDARLQYYREDRYLENDLTPARNWDELVSNSTKLTSEGNFGLVLPGQGNPAARQFSDFLWQAGGDFFDENYQVSFNGQEGIEAMEFYQSLVHELKVVSPDMVGFGWTEQTDAFAGGLASTLFDWPTAKATLNDDSASTVAGNVGFARLPANVTDISTISAHALAINKYSKNVDAAAAFMEYCTRVEQQAERYRDHTFFPSRMSVSEQLKEETSGEESEWLSDLDETVASGREWINDPRWNQIAVDLEGTVESILSGQQSAADALNRAAEEAQEIMGA